MPQGIKLLRVNHLVCLRCQKAQCYVCHCEVDSDPEFGCFHYSPDTGHLLNFIPEYCPLYSLRFFPGFSAIDSNKNKKDCKLCTVLKQDYPEYEVYSGKEKTYRVTEVVEQNRCSSFKQLVNCYLMQFLFHI